MEAKAIKNSFWLIYDKIFRLIGVVVFNLLLSNYLGAGFTGEYHFIVAFGYIFYAISLFGLDEFYNLISIKKFHFVKAYDDSDDRDDEIHEYHN